MIRRHFLKWAGCLMLATSFGASTMAAGSDEIVIGNSGGTVSLLDGTTLAVRATSATLGPIGAVAVAPNGEVIVGDNNDVYRLNGVSLATIGSNGPVGPVRDIAVKPNGEIITLAYASGLGGDYIYRMTSTLNVFISTGPFADPGQVAVSPNGEVIASDNSVYRRDGTSLAPLGSYGPLSATIGDLLVKPNGDIIVGEAYASGLVYEFNSTLALKVSNGPVGTVSALALSPFNNDLIVGTTEGFLYRLRSTDLGFIASAGGFGTISGVEVQPNGDIVIANQGGTVFLDAFNLSPITSASGFGQITAMALLPEPSTVTLASLALIGCFLRRRSRG